MPKNDVIEPRFTTLAPPSSVAAREQVARRARHAERAEEVDRDRLLEHVGLVLAAAAGEVLARVVHEHVEAVEARGDRLDVGGLGHAALPVGERREVDVVVGGRGLACR